MFNVSSLKTRIDDLRRDETSGTIDTNDIIGSINGTIDDLRSDVDISTVVNSKYFYYLCGKIDYSISNVLSVSDFSNYKDLRVAFSISEEFDYVTANDFAKYASNVADTVTTGKNAVSVETKGGDNVLKVLYQGALSKSVLHTAADHDVNGTWTANTTTSDALTVTTDTAEYIENAGSINFDIDVSQSAANHYAEIYVDDMTAVDLSGDAMNNRARIRMWVYIPSVTYISSFTLRWGSSNTAYHAVTVTVPANGGSFVNGWNELEFAWESASDTGTPDDSAINYLLFRVTYSSSQGDDTDFRINNIVAYEPKRLELVYYSKNLVDDGSGVSQEYVTSVTGTERILVPGAYLELFALGAVADIFDQQGDTAADALRYRARYNQMRIRFKAEVGVTKKRMGNPRFGIKNPWPKF